MSSSRVAVGATLRVSHVRHCLSPTDPVHEFALAAGREQKSSPLIVRGGGARRQCVDSMRRHARKECRSGIESGRGARRTCMYGCGGCGAAQSSRRVGGRMDGAGGSSGRLRHRRI